MLILNRRPGESVHIIDEPYSHATIYVVTFDGFSVTSSTPCRVKATLTRGNVFESFNLNLKDVINLTKDIKIFMDAVRVECHGNNTHGSLKMLFDLPPLHSARDVKVIRSEIYTG